MKRKNILIILMITLATVLYSACFVAGISDDKVISKDGYDNIYSGVKLSESLKIKAKSKYDTAPRIIYMQMNKREGVVADNPTANTVALTNKYLLITDFVEKEK